jgi:biotin operon repressor
LRIVGLLAEQPCSGEQLAATLGLSPSTVSYHLARLSNANLVKSHADGYYSIYMLETKTLDAMASTLRSQEALQDFATDVDLNAYDHKVLADTTLAKGEQKITSTQRKKRRAVLRHVVKSFETDQHYNEKQAKRMLAVFHADAATLLQELIREGLINHDSNGYWRVS